MAHVRPTELPSHHYQICMQAALRNAVILVSVMRKLQRHCICYCCSSQKSKPLLYQCLCMNFMQSSSPRFLSLIASPLGSVCKKTQTSYHGKIWPLINIG